ncbi:hypothetical protein Mapa_000098 [Marchantia paleacea]|nr:hypothetical protein Mapa_000098 [Marchantia paleacea]
MVKDSVLDIEPDAIILRTTLSDGHDQAVVTERRGHGAESVVASLQAPIDGLEKPAVSFIFLIQALEKLEVGGIRRIIAAPQPLNDDVSVALDDTILVKLLRESVILILGIAEEARLQIHQLYYHLKSLPRLQSRTIPGLLNYRGCHLVFLRDFPKLSATARASVWLLRPICFP